MVQSVTQDSLWLNKAAQAISNIRHACYFVKRDDKNDRNLETIRSSHVIMRLPESFRSEYDAAWRRLVRDDASLKLRFFRSAEGGEHLETWYDRFYFVFASLANYLVGFVESSTIRRASTGSRSTTRRATTTLLSKPTAPWTRNRPGLSSGRL